MTKTLAIVLTAVASAIATWWFRSQPQLTTARSRRGEVIFRNTPVAGPGE